LKHCAEKRQKSFTYLLYGGLTSFVSIIGIATTAKVSSEFVLSTWPLNYWFYGSECCGLTCMAVLSLVWCMEDVEKEGEHYIIYDPVNLAERIIGSCLPIAYVWSLPHLSTLGFAAPCSDKWICGKDSFGTSISNMITTPQATGAMAAVFFYPQLYSWLHIKKVGKAGRATWAALIATQISFGLFLSFPVSYAPHIHVLFTLSFCFSNCIFNYKLLQADTNEERRKRCKPLLGLAIISLSASLLVWCTGHWWGRDFIKDNCPWLLWAAQSVGFTAMALLPVCWYSVGNQVLATEAY